MRARNYALCFITILYFAPFLTLGICVDASQRKAEQLKKTERFIYFQPPCDLHDKYELSLSRKIQNGEFRSARKCDIHQK